MNSSIKSKKTSFSSPTEEQKSQPVLLTVATVTYKAVSLLERTLESVEQQDYPAVEHIIIDGASNDGTSELVKKYRDREAKHIIRFISEPDKGIYDAMNKALNMATGRYILFLNAGDKLHSVGSLSDVATATEGGTAAVIYGNTCIVDTEGRFLRERRLSPPEHLTWKSFKKGMLVCHQAFFARTDIAKKMPYNLKYRFSADFDWCIRIMRQAEREHLKLIQAHIIVADFLEGGTTIKNHRSSLWERFRIMSHHYGFLQTFGLHLFFVARALTKK